MAVVADVVVVVAVVASIVVDVAVVVVVVGVGDGVVGVGISASVRSVSGGDHTNIHFIRHRTIPLSTPSSSTLDALSLSPSWTLILSLSSSLSSSTKIAYPLRDKGAVGVEADDIVVGSARDSTSISPDGDGDDSAEATSAATHKDASGDGDGDGNAGRQQREQIDSGEGDANAT